MADVKGSKPAAPSPQPVPPKTSYAPATTARAQIARQVERDQRFKNSVRVEANGGGLRILLGIGFAIAVAFLGLDHFGYTDAVLDAIGLTNQAAMEARIQRDFKIKKRMTQDEMLVAQGFGLPSYRFGDEFHFQHSAKTGRDFPLGSGTMRYLVVGMMGERVSWKIGEKPARMTARNPFFGDLEDFTVPDDGRAPSSLTYVGDSAAFFPLKPGAKMELISARDSRETYACNVVGNERVTVPAGEFDTLKVECKSTGGARFREEVFYYSNIVGYWVRRQTFVRAGENERRDEFALSFYKRAPAQAAPEAAGNP